MQPFRAASSALAVHWSLDPGVDFLNHGSFGACPEPVLAEQARLRAELERQPVEFLHRSIDGRLDRARQALAGFTGAEAEDLVFVSNATTGVNAVLRSLDLASGDQVLTTDHEYNACRNALDFVAARAGAEVVVARVPFPLASPDEALEAILAAAGERTRLALVSHVTSPTGLVLPVREICAALGERGVPVLVDGAHAPGMFPLRIPDVGAAWYTGNCHKWLCTPKGAALLWVRRDLQAQVRPAVISHGANSARTDRSPYLLEFDWTGTMDPTAVLCIPAAIEFLGGLLEGGWPALWEHNRSLALEGRRILCAALEVAEPAPAVMIGSLASVPLPDGAPEPPRNSYYEDPLQTALVRDHRIEVPVVPWPSPPRRLIRISAQAYNAREQYQRLAEALPPLAESGSI